MRTTLLARQIFLPEYQPDVRYVTFEDGVISAVGPEPPDGSTTLVDLGDDDLLPGLVDLHSDCWVSRSRPRPTTILPLQDTLIGLDTEILAWGITTHFACVALQDDVTRRRTAAHVVESVDIVDSTRKELRADHRVHLRVEVTSKGIDVVPGLVSSDTVALLSYMDHTPGQGQHADVDEWRRIQQAAGATNVDELLADRLARAPFGERVRRDLAELARARSIPLGSHDDDSEKSVERAVELGASIAEFPVNASAVTAAVERGLLTVMGAPNALRGRSHNAGNLSARDALAAGQLGVLVSDYHPPSMLGAVYSLADEGLCSFEAAVALVTERPARAVRLTDRGRIAVGMRADLVAVTRRGGRPVVAQTWVVGRPAFGYVA